jgi:hypothetical protein
MLGGGPHVAQRHCCTLSSVRGIVAERLPNVIEEHLFELQLLDDLRQANDQIIAVYRRKLPHGVA